eukprot:SAG22_NODE_7131_length_772_cov_1.420505_1_plen_206_part_10
MSFDFYPLFSNPVAGKTLSDTRGRQLKLLEDARRTSLAHSVPFWNYFAGAGSPGFVPYGTGGAAAPVFVDITKAQMAWQVWTSLAFGSRGLLYYFWQQDVAHAHCRPFMTYPGMLDTKGKPSHHYRDAQQINSAVVALGPTLMRLRSTNTTLVDDNNPAVPASPSSNNIGNVSWPTIPQLAKAAGGGCPLAKVGGGALVVGCFEFT